MDLSLSPEHEEFRRAVRGWLKANVPKHDPEVGLPGTSSPERVRHLKQWQRKLYEAGYVGMGWPKEHGGRDADLMRQTIVNEELVLARAPTPIGIMGLQMVGPTLIQFGTPSQRRRFLGKILTGEEIWCQGYSEPGAGSDLASLKTRAELAGDEFVINGQKVWTSNANIADWMFCLVRTDPEAPKRRGISYVLIDMKTPGITVRPLVQMTADAGFSEVFFEDVRIPRENLVGNLNEGWRVANATLAHERNMLGSTTRTQLMFNKLLRLAKTRQRYGRPAGKDPIIRQRLADLMIRVEAMKYHSYRQLTDALHERRTGIGASVNKLVSTELNHNMATLALEILGDYGPLVRGSPHVVHGGKWTFEFMWTLGMIIGGGTSQIQKNIISERGLGMPR